MHPINFDSYVIVRLPNCRNHRHTNKKQLNQQVWQPKCNSRFNLEGPGLLEKSCLFLALFLMFTLTWFARALKSPWKSVMSLKSPWIEKLLDILEKSLKFPRKSLNIFESSLNKKNLHLKKDFDVLCERMIESKTIHKFSLVLMKVFSYDFGFPGIVHFPLFEVPLEPYLNEGRYWNKQIPLQLRILSLYFMLHVIGEKESLQSPLFFSKKFYVNRDSCG